MPSKKYAMCLRTLRLETTSIIVTLQAAPVASRTASPKDVAAMMNDPVA
jgi:hypothetical protein